MTSLALDKNNFKKCPVIDFFNKDEGTLFIAISGAGFPKQTNK